MTRYTLPLALLAAALIQGVSPMSSKATALGTAFTYQGRLQDGAVSMNGLYDFSFTVWSLDTGGAQIGPAANMVSVPVSNGLFTVTLDFGTGVFDGNARWLAIGVKTNLAAVYTPLAPRQRLNPTPYALYAGTAASAIPADSSVTSLKIADGTILALDIGAGQVVKSLNGLSDNLTLAAGDNVTVSPAGNVLTLASPTDWHLLGNGATIPGTHFLGTTDNQALWLKVQNSVGWRLVPSTADITQPNILGGAIGNSMFAAAKGTVIGGGASNSVPAAIYYGFLGGGYGNSLSFAGTYADYAVLGGGYSNITWGTFSVLGGGMRNTNSGSYSTIPGGYQNWAAGDFSFAVGRQAKAMNQGAFVWADSQPADFTSTANNQFLIRAAGNVGINKNDPGTALDVNGTVTATAFIGPGAGLTGVIPADGTVTSLKIADNTVAAVDLASDTNSLSKVSGGRMALSGNRVILPSLGTIDTTAFTGLGFQYYASGEGAIMSSFNDGYGFLSFYTKQGSGFPITKRMIIDQYGGVAIDQANANGGVINNGTAAGAALTFGPASGEGVGSKRTSGGNQYGLDFYTGFTPKMNISWYGDVGIGVGTNLPTSRLDVRGAIRVNDNDLYLRTGGDSGHGVGYRSTWDGPFVYGYNGGALGTSGPDMPALTWGWTGNVWVSNNLSVATLTVRGGADLAEPFPVRGAEVEPGTVMVIDRAHAGHLIPSAQDYDTRVAGIVSGAGGVKAGLELHQEGILDQGQKIALTGRVYVKTEALSAPVEPGDLLTTSTLPGYAMKASDRNRAQGAILGKAMTSLSEGKGLVLVLVTLQ